MSLTICITCVTIICLYSNIVYCKCIASNRWKKLNKVNNKQQQQQQCGPWKALFVHFLPHWGTGVPLTQVTKLSLSSHLPGSKKKKIYISLLLIQGVGWWSKTHIEYKTSLLHFAAFSQQWYNSREYYFNCFLSFLAKFWALFVV